MPALASDLRRQLENVIIQARDVAEAAACAALKRQAVDAARPFEHFSEAQRQWRNRLRARARQAGDQRQANGEQEIEQLTQELAYEYWHRMLFARFLSENNLLIHPDGVAVSLTDCEELAQVEGAANGWILAARYASRMLPQIFRTDDVLLEIEFPINDRLPLEKFLASLPPETFTADDSLGWVYQFWQSKKKEEVNRSGAKIDGRTLPAVTQLFTEPYMVKFLLHNTIGAWWCAQHGIKGSPGGAGVPVGQVPTEMEYLRWRDDGTPAAGSFDGWPKTLKEFTMLDPCCGSGHFLVEAFRLLVPLRMHDEGLSTQEACDAVLSENLFGLELDPRCTQIAAFALALAAWKYLGESGEPLGYRPLPTLNIACSGQSVTGKKEEWLALANGDSRLLEGMGKLYDLFRQAPHLGSLIDPRQEGGDLIAAGFAELQPLVEKALAKERVQQDADVAAVGVAAQGIAKAADLLCRAYTLVATNVPYLGFRDQADVLREYLAIHHATALADLATTFVDRCFRWSMPDCSIALVTPQNWLFLKLYKDFRSALLRSRTWRLAARLGARAFETITGEIVNVVLLAIDNKRPTSTDSFSGFDVSPAKSSKAKDDLLHVMRPTPTLQLPLTESRDCRLVLGEQQTESLIGDIAHSYKGIGTGDDPRFRRFFWEFAAFPKGWKRLQSSVNEPQEYGGCEAVVWLDAMTNPLQPGVYMRGEETWGKRGVLVRLISTLPTCLSVGEAFDQNVAVILPNSPDHLDALWAFCKSEQFAKEVRKIDQALKVTNGTLDQVPFGLDEWQQVAQGYGQIPGPYSFEPTQWLFDGKISRSTDSLQVAVARMLGYHWPDQPREEDAIDALADRDGIVCIPAVRGEQSAAERLLDVLRTAYASQWSDAILHKLLTDAGCRPGTSLDDWLRDRFFEQHCKRFHQRPFIWHIWDGRKDSFSCLVNYHKFDHQRLETLTYAYLQDWIMVQTAAARDGKPGADLRLAAAQELQNKLKLILDGEPPYDIFVRWKPIHEQPIGWNPEITDGVRVNIRPFVMANALRKPQNIKWTKDRGKEPERDPEQFPWLWKNGAFTGDRINDVHLTNAQKRTARERVNRGTGG